MRALISVSNKEGIVSFAKGLEQCGVEIISTGGTQKLLEEQGIKATGIEEVTGFPEMMDGRVKTLHPMIHGGLLACQDRPSHMTALAEHGIEPIDLVCVNLYPFKETLQKAADHAQMIEMIDIGGPSMLRSSAKNHAFTTVVTDPKDYPLVLEELTRYGETLLTTRQKLAARAFQVTAAYDALIADYLADQFDTPHEENRTITFERKQTLRYGENSHQKATFYQYPLPSRFSLASAHQLHGKELSYNNLRDADAALRIVREFDEPTVVAVKHMNPCGIGTGSSINEAWDHAYEADEISIFGGIIVLNRPVDQRTAKKMSRLFLEIILAPAYSDEALEILCKKKNLRILQLSFDQQEEKPEPEVISVMGGVLIQERDDLPEMPESWQVVTRRQPSEEEQRALAFAWRAVKHVKSNAILLANDHQTVGIGAGQMNRIGSVEIAVKQAAERIDGAVLASDAFFPMDDSVQYAAEHGIKAIIQPGGSIKDDESIAMADRYGMTMIFTGRRHFRH